MVYDCRTTISFRFLQEEISYIAFTTVNSDTSHTVCAHFYFICIVLLYLCHLVFVLLKHIQILFDIANHFPKYVLLCCQCARYTNNSRCFSKDEANCQCFQDFLVMYIITTAGTVHATPLATEARKCFRCEPAGTICQCEGDHPNLSFSGDVASSSPHCQWHLQANRLSTWLNTLF
jgi:hypothetical protein